MVERGRHVRFVGREDVMVQVVVDAGRDVLAAVAPAEAGGSGAVPPRVKHGDERRQVDLLITTAHTEEARVVEAVLGHVAVEVAEECDVTYYQYALGRRTACVATASAHKMDAVDLSAFAASMFTQLAPRSATLVGIAAAVDRSEIGLGDVPFASQVLNYDDIVIDSDSMTFRTAGYPTDPAMQRAAGRLRTKPRHYAAWQADCLGCIDPVLAYVNALRRIPITLPPAMIDRPRPHMAVGIEGGGPFLIRDYGFRNPLRAPAPQALVAGIGISAPGHARLISAEMESHGFMGAALAHGVPATVLTGISDIGDKDKDMPERITSGFFRVFACSNATLAALHILRCADHQSNVQDSWDAPATKLANKIQSVSVADATGSKTTQTSSVVGIHFQRSRLEDVDLDNPILSQYEELIYKLQRLRSALEKEIYIETQRKIMDRWISAQDRGKES